MNRLCQAAAWGKVRYILCASQLRVLAPVNHPSVTPRFVNETALPALDGIDLTGGSPQASGYAPDLERGIKL
ncbi:hypothetical protein JCM25156A_08220 [Komagataeibacter kakiaceti JCM 25156]